MKMILTAEECNCGICTLYDTIATKLGFDLESVRYDCRKILVSKEVADYIEEFCIKHAIEESFAMAWLAYGPKIDDTLKGTEIVIEEGFIQEKAE